MGQPSHGRRLVFLAALAAGIQLLTVHQTLLPARDNIHFIRIAHGIAADGVLPAVRRSEHHPLYPLAIAACHRGALWLGVSDDPQLWLRSAQFAAVIPLILLPLAAYGVGLRLFNPAVAFGSGVLVGCLPAVAQLGADGMTEGWYLLFFLLGFLACLEYLASQRVGWLFASGLAAGLAYLARPEGLLLPLAVLLSLGIAQTVRSWRLPWSRTARGAVALVTGALVMVAPYSLVKGTLTDKQSLARALNQTPPPRRPSRREDLKRPDSPLLEAEEPATTVASARGAESARPGKAVKSFRFKGPAPPLMSHKDALREFVSELVESLSYVFAAAALIGLLFPVSARPRPVDVPVLVMLIVFSVALVESASHGGFVSTRHVLTPACLLVNWSVHGGCVLAAGVAALCRRLEPVLRFRRSAKVAASKAPQHGVAAGDGRRLLGARLALLSSAVLFCVVQLSEHHREDRLGHIKAARWLAENTPAEAVVLDTYGWASLLSNRPAYLTEAARHAFRNPRLAYVVAHRRFLDFDTQQSRNIRELLDVGGRRRVLFPCDSGDQEDAVAIYEFSLSRANEQLAAGQHGDSKLR